MNNWTLRSLREISDSCLGKMLDQEKNKGEFYPYLGNINVRWGGFSLDNLEKMRFEEDEQDRYGLVYGDLVICEGGEPGRCSIWRDQMANMKIQKALHRLRVKSGYSADFLYYHMLLAGKTKQIDRHFIGSTIKHLTGIALKNVEFKFPEYDVQVKIAVALRSLDSKIELNNRINAELEAMAKTIYEYWFVQFDFPDAQGRPYKSSGGKMVYNAPLKRKIPESWQDGSLGDLGQIVGGSTPTTTEEDNFDPNGIPWISPVDLSRNAAKFISRGAMGVTEKGFKAASLKKYPKGTVLLSSRAPIGYMAIARNALTTNQGFKSFIPSKGFSTAFIYYTVDANLKSIHQSASGSTFKEVSGGVLKTIKTPLPPKDLVAKFTEKIQGIFDRQDLLEQENQQLAELRDWLLPMLMNGQVKAGEKI